MRGAEDERVVGAPCAKRFVQGRLCRILVAVGGNGEELHANPRHVCMHLGKYSIAGGLPLPHNRRAHRWPAVVRPLHRRGSGPVP